MPQISINRSNKEEINKMKCKYSKLFSEIKINNMVVKNRIEMAPMATHFATYNGYVTERLVEYYKARAAGGVGLITIEATSISSDGFGWKDNLSISDDTYIEGLSKLADEVHKAGAKVAIEIFHAGQKAKSFINGRQPIAPSSVAPFIGEMPRELTLEEIKELIYKFGQAAKRAKKAGFDAVNLHMAHGYLIKQFLSPISNKRIDEYGGNTKNRAKFAMEVIEEVRKQVGKDYPVICRITGNEYKIGGIDVEESKKISCLLADAGADMISVSAEDPEAFQINYHPMCEPEGMYAYISKAIKEVVSIPVAVVGRIITAEEAERIIVLGYADSVVMGRALIADPELPNKAARCDEKNIRQCIGCNQGCSGRFGKNLDVNCVVNPMAGREYMLKDLPMYNNKKIMIIGGGISGMNAALELKKSGNHVELFERDGCLGGQALIASVPSYKKAILTLVDYLKNQLNENNVTMHLNTKIDINTIKSFKPDLIIQASGAQPKTINIPGIEDIKLFSAWEVLKNKECPGNRIAVLGGGEVGLETCEFISKQGKKLFLIEMKDDIGQDMSSDEKFYILNSIKKNNIEIYTSSRVIKIEDKKLYFQRGGLLELINNIDTVIYSIGSDPTELDVLDGLNIPIIKVGDAMNTGRIYEAMQHSFMAKYIF